MPPTLSAPDARSGLRAAPVRSRFEHQPTRVRRPSPTLLLRCDRAASDIADGTDVGPFRVTAKLHEGRFATVFAAVERGSGCGVALRMLDADHAANPLAISCLERSERIARQVDHDAVPEVLAVGSHRGRAYAATRLVTGLDLERVIRRRLLPPRSAVDVLVSLCDVLATSHRRGIVHRDLCPRHVLVTSGRDDAPGVSLVGFDLALCRAPERWEPARANPNLLTSGYRAPEVARNLEASVRSDVFSLGVIAYELLLAQHPFGSAPDALLGRTLTAPYLLWPEIPADLDLLLRRMLADEPGERPSLASVCTLLVVLRASMPAQTAELPAPSSPASRGRERSQRLEDAATIETNAVDIEDAVEDAVELADDELELDIVFVDEPSAAKLPLAWRQESLGWHTFAPADQFPSPDAGTDLLGWRRATPIWLLIAALFCFAVGFVAVAATSG